VLSCFMHGRQYIYFLWCSVLLELCIDMTLKLVVDETPTDGEQHLFKECHVVKDSSFLTGCVFPRSFSRMSRGSTRAVQATFFLLSK
jgi:hypothetical protein